MFIGCKLYEYSIIIMNTITIRKMKPSTLATKTNKLSNPLVEEYLKSLSPKEYKAYEIAKNHLGTTFNIEKSNAFLRWKSERETK